MNKNNIFRINVGFMINQPVGTYREFTIDTPDLELDEDTKASNVHCEVRVSRVQQGILAEVDCSAETPLECTRCLELYTQQLKSHFDELFYFHFLRENENAELFLPETGYMDLAELVREYLVLEIPYAPVCREDCKGLCPICGKNLNLGSCSHPKEEQDGFISL